MLVFRRVWHPCHTHAALLLILPQKPQNAQKFLAEKSLPQTHRRRVWHPAIPTPPAGTPNLCSSVCICGRLFSARNFCQFCGFRGRIGKRAAWVWQDAIPSYKNSHRLHCHATPTILPRYNNKIATQQQQDCHATIKHHKRTSNQETNKQSRNEQTPTLHISRETDGK